MPDFLRKRPRMLRFLFVMVGLCLAAPSVAQDRPIVLVAPADPGGLSDVMTRNLANSMSSRSGEVVVVENLAGGSGAIAEMQLLGSRPDGLTLGTRILARGQGGAIFDQLELLGSVAQFDPILFVSEDSGLEGLAEVVEQAGELTFVTQGDSALARAAMRGLTGETGLDLKQLLVQGSTAPPVLAGEADVGISFGWRGSVDGLRAIAVLGPERADVLPDVPTAREQGYDIVASSQFVVLAPPGLDGDALNKAMGLLELAVSDEAFRAMALNLGATRVALLTGDEFRAEVDSANNDFCEECDCDDADCQRNCPMCQ